MEKRLSDDWGTTTRPHHTPEQNTEQARVLSGSAAKTQQSGERSMKDANCLNTGMKAFTLAMALLGCATGTTAADATGPDAGTFATPSRVATTVVAKSSLSQIGVAGLIVVYPPAVVVPDQNGRAMANVEVHFVVTNGGGTAVPEVVKTDVDGFAVTSWSLGDTNG